FRRSDRGLTEAAARSADIQRAAEFGNSPVLARPPELKPMQDEAGGDVLGLVDSRELAPRMLRQDVVPFGIAELVKFDAVDVAGNRERQHRRLALLRFDQDHVELYRVANLGVV